jgi:transcriptional regulator with XRE-family HTH domain
MNFGTRLRELRESKGIHQAELARRSGVPQTTISDLENNASKQPTWDKVQLLAKALGVDCRAFTDETLELPEAPPTPSRGRPPKPASDEPTPPKGKRGRPKKEGAG